MPFSDVADILCEDLLRNEVIKDCSTKIPKEIHFEYFSKQALEFQISPEVRSAWHLGRS